MPVCNSGLFAKFCGCMLAILLSVVDARHVVNAGGLPEGVSHVITFPPSVPRRGAVNPRVGFSTSVGFTDFSSVGYQPVEIIFNSPLATTADLRLSYRIASHKQTQTPDDNGLVVDVPIVVPEGTKNATWVRYLPKWMMGNGYKVVVSRDGKPLPGFEGSVGDSAGYRELGSYLYWELQARHELGLDLLLITPDPVLKSADADSLFSLSLPWKFETTVPFPQVSQVSGMYVNLAVTALACGSGNLPEDWRGYQRWDLIVLTKAAITRMKGNEDQWNALYGWVLCGGTLAVWDAETQAELETLFDRPVTRTQRLSLEQIRKLGIATTDLQRAGLRVDGTHSPRASGLQPSNLSFEGFGKLANFSHAFYGFAVGAGKVLSVNRIPPKPVNGAAVTEDSASVEAGLANEAKWHLYTKLMEKDVSSILRSGADPILGNAEFRKWLVLGVAQPPVYVLVTLLTIFVILVGPVAYRRTTKTGRGHLMFVIAPVLALVTTVSMFAYGLAADGFSTIARIRQITWVDGATGDAGERVRATYFAPISPGDGLKFPGDSEVISVRRPDSNNWETRHNFLAEPLGLVTITQRTQRFSSSFLPSREQRQFVSHRPRLGVGNLAVKITGAEEVQCQVTNGFGYRVNDAILRDRAGEYWRIQNIEPGESQVAEATTAKAAAPVLGKYFLDHNPVATNGSRSAGLSSWRGGVMDLTAELNEKLHGSSRWSEGRFESWLRQTLQLNTELPGGCFVAICDVTQDASAINGCNVEDSVHYVIGTLP
jgi:hypothetical protein